jgi:membrane protein implicated in regulation of membrane protease activity
MANGFVISRSRLALALVAILALAIGVRGMLPMLGQAGAYLLPALLLSLALAARCYPGERALLALAGRRRQRRRRQHPEPKPRRPRHVRATFARGGALIASSLAGRAPPLAGRTLA